jgi:hypothetical protein
MVPTAQGLHELCLPGTQLDWHARGWHRCAQSLVQQHVDRRSGVWLQTTGAQCRRCRQAQGAVTSATSSLELSARAVFTVWPPRLSATKDICLFPRPPACVTPSLFMSTHQQLGLASHAVTPDAEAARGSRLAYPLTSSMCKSAQMTMAVIWTSSLSYGQAACGGGKVSAMQMVCTAETLVLASTSHYCTPSAVPVPQYASQHYCHHFQQQPS